MQQDVRTLKQKMQCCGDPRMSLPDLVKLGSRMPEKALSVLPRLLKLHGVYVLNRR